jgi:site-specific recombinase XerC
LVRASVCGTEGRGFEPHHLPNLEKRPKMAAFRKKGHISDTLLKAIKRMQPPSVPKINKENPKEWFIFWNHDVPEPLWHKYPRKRIRIKIKDDINRYRDKEKEAYAEKRRQVWQDKLEKLNYNPFEEQLKELYKVTDRKIEIQRAIEEVTAVKELSTEEQRKLTPIRSALTLWVENRKGRTKNGNSVSTYRVTANWLTKYFESVARADNPITTVTRLDLSTALEARKKEKNWEATTFNNELDTLMNIFNWLAKDEYIERNPIAGKKIDKIPTSKHKHKWYDKDIKATVKAKLIERNELLVYRVMQFTYMILIRSKTELMKLKAGDIDRTLKRVRFSAELSKNNIEAFRQYPPEFEQVLDEMDFNSIPKNFYVFGRNGDPSEFKCHKDLFAVRWRPIRDELGLTDDYTIYGMKHTRIVHELMKKTDGLDISYMARHEDPKSTKEYQRDYDITLEYLYKPEDLKF